MKNHYEILGLNPTGKNDQGMPYSEKEIKKAYKKVALKHHPDKNENSNLFVQIGSSYEILMDPQKRSAFDENIEKNPQAYISKEHLFVDIPEDFELSKEVGNENNNFAILSHKKVDIDITQLILNADYDSEQILKHASANFTFAQAILDDVHTLNVLSESQRFELLLIVNQHFIDQGSTDQIKTIFFKPNVKELVSQLKHGDSQIGSAFMAACTKLKERAANFFKYAHEEILNHLSLNVLVALGKSFSVVAHYAVQHCANSLKLKELDYIFSEYPELYALYEQHANKKNRERQQTYKYLAEKIKKLGFDFVKAENFEEKIEIIGVDAFSLLDRLKIGGSDEKIVIELLVKLLIFNIFTKKDVDHYKNEYGTYELNELISTLIYIFGLMGVLEKSEKESGRSKLKSLNWPVVLFLLENMSQRSFENFLCFLNCDIFTEQQIEDIANFVLNKKENDEESPWFLKFLLASNKIAIDVLNKNKRLLVALLNNRCYQEKLLGNQVPHLQRMLALFAARFELNIDSPALSNINLPEDFCVHFEAAKELYNFINNNNKDSIDWKEFEKLYEQTGFFEDLLEIRTVYSSVKTKIVKDALQVVTEIDESKLRSSKFFEFFSNVLRRAFQDEVNELLLLCPKNILVDILGRIEKSLLDFHRIGEAISMIETMVQCTPWAYQNMTGGIVNQWRIIFNSENFKNDMILYYKGYFDRFKMSTELVDDFFNKLCQMYSESDSADFRHSPIFKNFLQILQSPVFKDKASGFDSLCDFLDKIKAGNFVINDELLDILYLHLSKTGLDAPILNWLKKNLEDHPELLSTVLTLIVESEEFKLPDKLRKEVDGFLANLAMKKRPEVCFLKMAERYLDKYRDMTDGYILLEMANAHGEKITPKINQFGLQYKLINAQKASKTLRTISQGTAQFRRQSVELAEQLIQKFKKLAGSAMNADMQQSAVEYHAELLATVSKNNIEDQRLDTLMKAYPREEKNTLLMWIVALTLDHQEFAKEILIDHLVAGTSQNFIYPHLAKHVLYQIEKGELDFNRLAELFGDDIVQNILVYCLKQPDQPVYRAGLDYIKTRLAHRQLKYEDLLNFKGIDIKEQVLKHIYLSNGTLIEIENIGDLSIYFDVPCHDKVVRWLLDQCQSDSIPTKLHQAICERIAFEQLTLRQVSERYGGANQLKLLEQSVTVEEKVFMKEALKVPTIINYFNHADIQFYQAKNVLSFDKPRVELFPLFDQEIFDKSSIRKIYRNPLHYQAHCEHLKNADWSDKESIKKTANGIKNFFEGQYFDFVQRKALKPLEKNIVRLKDEQATIKVSQLKTSQKEINKLIIKETLEVAKFEKEMIFNQQLNTKLIRKVNEIAKKPKINGYRNRVPAYLKVIAGVLIAAPLMFVPLASKKYRQTFFYSETEKTFDEMHTDLSAEAEIKNSAIIKGV